MADTCIWPDSFGNQYTYSVCDMHKPWADDDGNYIFTGLINGLWVPLYIGEGRFKTRMVQSHECWLPAVRLGATQVHAHINRNALARAEEERRLIQTYNPPLNIQHRVAWLRPEAAAAQAALALSASSGTRRSSPRSGFQSLSATFFLIPMSKTLKVQSGPQCIFCGGSGLTAEHLFPDWLKKFECFKRGPHDKHTYVVVQRKPIFKEATMTRHGHSGSRKLRRLCNTCNNGWVSQMDNAVKPFLPSLFQGEWSTVNEAEQAILAKWLTKITMVGDTIGLLDRPAYIPAPQRKWFYDHKEPPTGWKIWVGSFAVNNDFECDLRIFQDGGNLNRTPVSGPSDATSPFGYIQVTTIIIGRLLALIYSTDNPRLFDFHLNAGNPLLRIWPIQDKPIAWPRMMPLTSEETSQIINILQNTAMPIIPDGEL
jgi:hypothetical protein